MTWFRKGESQYYYTTIERNKTIFWPSAFDHVSQPAATVSPPLLLLRGTFESRTDSTESRGMLSELFISGLPVFVDFLVQIFFFVNDSVVR